MTPSDSTVHIEVHRDDAVPTCRVRGEIDASNVDSVLDRLLGCVDADEPGLVLDLGETTYIDSAGIRALFELSRRMRIGGQELRIAAPADGLVRRVLVLTAFADVVPLHGDVADAVAAMRTPS
jgi:anti-sigma B factor antagonist